MEISYGLFLISKMMPRGSALRALYKDFSDRNIKHIFIASKDELHQIEKSISNDTLVIISNLIILSSELEWNILRGRSKLILVGTLYDDITNVSQKLPQLGLYYLSIVADNIELKIERLNIVLSPEHRDFVKGKPNYVNNFFYSPVKSNRMDDPNRNANINTDIHELHIRGPKLANLIMQLNNNIGHNQAIIISPDPQYGYGLLTSIFKILKIQYHHDLVSFNKHGGILLLSEYPLETVMNLEYIHILQTDIAILDQWMKCTYRFTSYDISSITTLCLKFYLTEDEDQSVLEAYIARITYYQSLLAKAIPIKYGV